MNVVFFSSSSSEFPWNDSMLSVVAAVIFALSSVELAGEKKTKKLSSGR